MKVRRFFYTGPLRSNVVHICYAKTHVEGNKTACGRFTLLGWGWWRKAQLDPFRICKQCEAASAS